MYKIGDFSKLGQVSARMLRHYDKLGLLMPGYTDEDSGYRYYTVDQLPRLHRIIALKDLGFTLKQVGDLLAEDNLSLERLRGMLVMRKSEIERELEDFQARLINVESRLARIGNDDGPSRYEIVVKSTPAMHVAGVRQDVPEIAQMGYYCKTMFGTLYKYLEHVGVSPRTPELMVYHQEEYTETNLDVEAAVCVAASSGKEPAHEHLRFHDIPAAESVATLVFEGPFRESAFAAVELVRWIGEHRHTITGPMRELHLSGRAHSAGEVRATSIIELQLPFRPLAGA